MGLGRGCQVSDQASKPPKETNSAALNLLDLFNILKPSVNISRFGIVDVVIVCAHWLSRGWKTEGKDDGFLEFGSRCCASQACAAHEPSFLGADRQRCADAGGW